MTSEIQMLFNQQLSEYHEIQDLREKLRQAEARHQKLADEIQQLLAAQPVGDVIPSTVAPAPACTTLSAGSGILEVQAVREMNRWAQSMGNPAYDLEWYI